MKLITGNFNLYINKLFFGYLLILFKENKNNWKLKKQSWRNNQNIFEKISKIIWIDLNLKLKNLREKTIIFII